MSFDRRRSGLLRVLAIESKIKDIQHSQDFLKVKEEIRILETARKRPGVLLVSNPDEMSSVVKLSRNSESIEEYLNKYRLMIQGLQDQMDRLNVEKSRLKTMLLTA